MEEEKKYRVTPIGLFNAQEKPIDPMNVAEITEEQKEALARHELCWSTETYEEEYPIYEEHEDENGEIVSVQTGVHVAEKTRPILVPYDNTAEVEQEKERRYKRLVVQYIRERYTMNDEFKIQREFTAGRDNGEFANYDLYAESCKQRAYNEVYGG